MTVLVCQRAKLGKTSCGKPATLKRPYAASVATAQPDRLRQDAALLGELSSEKVALPVRTAAAYPQRLRDMSDRLARE